MELNPKVYHCWVGGKEVAGHGDLQVQNLYLSRAHTDTTDSIPVEDPSTGEIFAHCHQADEADVDNAVQVAHRTFTSGIWSRASRNDRADVLDRIAEKLITALPTLIPLEVRQTGRAIREMNAQVPSLVKWFKYYASLIRTEERSVLPTTGELHNWIDRKPLGVVVQITPFNHPLLIAVKKIAPALAAGNSVILKPSELTPLTSVLLGKFFREAGLPDGVFSVLPGYGASTGKALVSHRLVKKVDVTGGTDAGRAIGAIAGRNLAHYTAELGGKAPLVVFKSAHLDVVVNGIAFASFMASGQTCIAATRIIVHSSRMDELMKKLRVKCESITQRIGAPSNPESMMGPLISAKQLTNVESLVNEARSEGANVHCGGTRMTGTSPLDEIDYSKGYFYPPTVLSSEHSGHPLTWSIWKKEVFGPVIIVSDFENEEDAIAQANDCDFGLGASIWSQDLSEAFRVSESIDAGICWVNTHHRNDPSSPWGGIKDSGMGSENGVAAYHAYTSMKSTIINYASAEESLSSDDWFRDGTGNVRRWAYATQDSIGNELPDDVLEKSRQHHINDYYSTAQAAQITDDAAEQQRRATAIIEQFRFAWGGYYQYAFPNDDLIPTIDLSANSRNGWGATAVDSLTTAIIMEQTDIVHRIMAHIEKLDFTKTGTKAPSRVSVFESTIRYLGGLLEAYDLLQGPFTHLTVSERDIEVLLAQARSLADAMKFAFDTPSGIPINDIWLERRKLDQPLRKSQKSSHLAELGTLQLEWQRLSDLTDDPEYVLLAAKAVSHWLNPVPASADVWPGLTGSTFDVETGHIEDRSGGWGAYRDSAYEYLLKMYIYDPDRFQSHRDFFIQAADSSIEHLASSPASRPDLTMLGEFDGHNISQNAGHLNCFAGGTFILAGRVLARPDYLDMGLKIADFCASMYANAPAGIGASSVSWDPSLLEKFPEQRAHFEQAGWFVGNKTKGGLMPAAVESWYYAYQVTGDQKWRDLVWNYTLAQNQTSRVGSGFAKVVDVMAIDGGGHEDEIMESFMLAETLKYQYMIQSEKKGAWEPEHGGENVFVYNTEAHPIKVAEKNPV